MRSCKLSLVVCPVCGQVNVCSQTGKTCVCPVCQSSSDLADEISIELIR